MMLRLLTLLVLGVLALPGQAAATTHASLGAAASKAGSKLFDDACGVAIDGSGEFYVSDFHNRNVAAFQPDGSYVFSIPSARAESSPCDLAVDSSSHIYGNYLHQGVVELFNNTTIDPGRSTGISINSADDRLYVAHHDHVAVYEPNGNPVLYEPTGTPIPLTIGGGNLGDAYGVAVSNFPSTQGYVYVGDASDNTVKVFDPATDPLNPVQVIDGTGTPPGAFADLTDTDLAIDPASGHIFVVDNLQPEFAHPLAAVYEFDAAGTYLGQISRWIETVSQAPLPPKFFNRTLIDARPTGVAIGSNGAIYVTSGNQEGSVLYRFDASPTSTVPLQVAKAGSGSGTVNSQFAGASPSPTPFPGISCGLICATEYEPPLPIPGFPVLTLTAAPSPHSRFTGWSGACSGTGQCKPALAGSVQVTATFAAISQRTLTLIKSGGGEGDVTSLPVGLDCGPTCSASFDQNTKITLIPEAAPGAEFTGFSGACSGSGPCKVTLGEDLQVTASFERLKPPTANNPSNSPRRLAITVGGSGAGTVSSDPAGIDCGTPCSGLYAPGSMITLIATPDSESHFSGWSGCDSVSQARCSVTLNSSKTVAASFDEGPDVILRALEVKGAKATLAVSVPGPGTVKASAKNLAPSMASAARAGTVKVSLALSKTGKRALASSKNGRLTVKVAIAFTSSGGATPLVLTKVVTFTKGKSRK